MSASIDPLKRNTTTPSGRKGSAKVRSGCITCKARKVKCDEGKPSCLRCIKSGRSCDGYLDPSVMASRRKPNKNNNNNNNKSSADISGPYPTLSTLLDGALPEEKRSFHFFQHVTAPNLAGDLDAIFWKVLVLQVCQTEPAVRHAVLAVSSLHEYMASKRGHINFQRPGSSRTTTITTTEHMESEPHQAFALHQYNKAIACLIGQMKDTTSRPLAPLLTCVLFVCLEFMHGKDRESLIHLEQGRQLLSKLDQRADSKDPEIDIVKRHLVPLYLRLSLTAFLFGGTPVPIPQSLKSLKEVPATFESVQEIRFSLYDFIDEVLRYLQRARMARYDPGEASETPAELEREKEDLLQRLSRLSVAFSLYQASRPTHISDVNAAVFQMYLHIMTIWVSTAVSNTEACFDHHLPSFSAIIPHAATILNHSASPPADLSPLSRDRLMQARPGEAVPTRQNYMFTFETYVIPVLYYVATKCRHPLIRHSALDLLRQNPNRRENLWHAKKMAAIAEYVVRVEEESVAGSNPGSPVGQHPLGNVSNPFMPFQPPVLVMPGNDGSQTSDSAAGYGDMLSPSDAFVPTQLTTDGLEPSSPAGDDYTRQSLNNNNDALQQQTIMQMQNAALMGLENPALSVEPGLSVDMDSSFGTEGSYISQGGASVIAGLGSIGRHSVDPSGAAETFRFLTPSQYPQHSRSGPPSRTPSVVSRGSHSQAEDWPYGGHEGHRQQQRTISTSSDSDSSGSPEMQALVRFESTLAGLGHYGYPQSHLRQQPAPARHFSSLEAPFDIPEHMRVHDVIINREKDDGSWLTVFRKLHGPAAEWDVATKLIVA